MSVVLSEETEALRRALFRVCETKEELHFWILGWLGIDLPDCTVSDESNSNPMELVWECYDKMRRNDLEGFQRVLAYAGRGGIKTLGASILEMLQVLHLERPTTHMAAIIDQGKVSQEYVLDFVARETIRDFKVSQNDRRINFLQFHNPTTGQTINREEWRLLTEAERRIFRRIPTYIKLVPCTMTGANSTHTLNMTVDEVDVVPTQHIRAYRQAKHIPEPRRGLLPFTLLTSTRKSSIGLVQKEIDEAKKTGTVVKHWNLIDVTEACPPSRHKPEGEKVTRYIRDADFSHIDQTQYDQLDEAEQKKYYTKQAYEGCVTCPLFAACKGALATKQKSNSFMLKPLVGVIQRFKETDAEEAQTELMCRKADSSGLVFPRFDEELHGLTAAQIWTRVTGEPPPDKCNYLMVMDRLLQREAKFGVGIDWGFTHAFAWTLGVQWGRYMYILDCDERTGLELDDKVLVCQPLKKWNAKMYADPEDPASTTTFRKKGFQMVRWDKFQGSVKFSIQVVRARLKPAIPPDAEPLLYFCVDNPRVAHLMDKMKKYALLTDSAGQPTEEPNDEGMDGPVSVRYLVLNTYAPKGKLINSEAGTMGPEQGVHGMMDQVKQSLGQSPDEVMAEYMRVKLSGAPEQAVPKKEISKPGFIFDS